MEDGFFCCGGRNIKLNHHIFFEIFSFFLRFARNFWRRKARGQKTSPLDPTPWTGGEGSAPPPLLCQQLEHWRVLGPGRGSNKRALPVVKKSKIPAYNPELAKKNALKAAGQAPAYATYARPAAPGLYAAPSAPRAGRMGGGVDAGSLSHSGRGSALCSWQAP